MSAIFISHSSVDKAVADKLVKRLEQQGHKSIFLDFDPERGIPAGTNWEQVLYAKLRACRAIIVLCSPHSIASKWCFSEITIARSLGKCLFPVIVSPCDLQSVFSDTQVIDLSDENNYQRLWRGLKEAGLDDVFDWDGKRDPYPGLSAFQEKDAALFFGRKEEIHKSIDLLRKIRRSGAERLVLFLGASGSGKSSLVRAGIIPRLKKDQDNWVVVDPFRPNEELGDPFFNLAKVISAKLKDQPSMQDINDLHTQLLLEDQSIHPLLLQVRALLGNTNTNHAATVLVFIDQFEELLGTRSNISYKQPFFLKWLGDAIYQAQKNSSCPLIVVTTLRSDFFVDLQQTKELQHIDYAEFSVKPIPKNGLGELIEGPANLVKLELESGLVPRIIEDIKTQNALPLLAFTLSELWNRYGKDDNDLTLAEYTLLGGVGGAVKKAAEDAFSEEDLNAEQEAALRTAFLAMVQVGETNQYKRKKADISKLSAVALPMLEKLYEARLLNKSETGNTYEVAHESLFQEWGILKRWLTENHEFLGWRRRIQADLQKWEFHEKEDEGDLLRGASLAEAEGWFKKHQGDLQDVEKEFFKASVGLRDREARYELKQQNKILKAEKKTARNFKWFSGVTFMLLIIASLIAWYAIDQKNEADIQTILAVKKTKEAKKQTLEANYNLAKVFEEKGLQELEEANKAKNKIPHYQRAFLYAAAALKQPIAENKRALVASSIGKLFSFNVINQSFSSQRWFSPHTNLGSSIRSVTFSPDGLVVVAGLEDKSVHLWDVSTGQELIQLKGAYYANSIDFSPDGKTIVLGSADGVVYLFDVLTGKELKTLKGHTKAVSSVAFGPTGQVIVTGALDNTLRLWDLDTGKELKILTGHNGSIKSVAFSPDGQLVASGSTDKSVRLWNVTTGKELKKLTGHSGSVQSVVFSPDGQVVVSGSTDKTLRLWDVAKAQELHQFLGHTSQVNSVAFSPDGLTLVSGSKDKTLRLWDVDKAQELKQLLGHTSEVNRVAFSPDGLSLISGGLDRSLRLWNVATGKELDRPLGHRAYVISVAVSSDGRMIASGSGDKTLRLWDAITGKELKQLEGHKSNVNSVFFSPNSQLVVSGARDKSVRLWDVSTGKELKLLGFHKATVRSVAFSPDGRTIVSGGDDNIIRLWDTTTGNELKLLSGHSDLVMSVAFSPDGLSVASGSRDKSLRIWDVATGKELKKMTGHTQIVWSVAFSPDGQTVISGSSDRTLRLWDIVSGKELKKMIGHINGIRSVAFSPDGLSVVSGSEDKSLRIWDVATGRELRILTGHTDSIQSVTFSPGGDSIVSGSFDNSLRLWNVITDQEVTVMGGHTGGINGFAFSPDNLTLASGSVDKSIRLWSVSNGKELKKLSGHSESVSSVSFSPYGLSVVSGSKDKSLRIWDVITGKELKKLIGHTDNVQSVAFSPDGQSIASGSKDKTLRLWNVATGQELKELSGHISEVQSVAFSPDGQSIASGSKDKTLRLWDVVTGKELKQLGHNGPIDGVAYSPDGQVVASGSHNGGNGNIQLWNIKTSKELKRLSFHDSVNNISLSSQGEYLLSGMMNSVTLWDISTGQKLKQLPSAFTQASFSPDGNTIAFSDKFNIKLWNIKALLLFQNNGKGTKILRNFSEACEFLWQLQLDGLEIKRKPWVSTIKPQGGYNFSYDKKLRPLLNPPKPEQTKFDQVLEWAIEQSKTSNAI